MNQQNSTSNNHIEWTRVINPDGTRRPGYTWNPIGGCHHACKWQMPDGSIAQCYAKSIAERFNTAYPQGFEHHYWRPHQLNAPLKLKAPAGIFLDSMSDLMGAWVPAEQVNAVLDVCRQADWHIFLLLTKNAPRLLKFDLPANVWVGVSSPPDWYMGRRLTPDQQQRMLHKALKVLDGLNSNVTWMSFEPLSWDVAPVVSRYPNALDWSVIGAASNGRAEFPPDKAHVKSLLNILDTWGVPVFYKGNMRTVIHPAEWRESFPAPHSVEKQVQMRLF